MRISLPKLFLSVSAIACYLTSPYYKGALSPWIDAQTAQAQEHVHGFSQGLHEYAENWVTAAQVRQRIAQIENDLELKNTAARQSEPPRHAAKADEPTP